MKRLRHYLFISLLILLSVSTVTAFHVPPWDTGHNSFTGDSGNNNPDPGPTGPERCGSPVEIATGNFIFSTRHLLVPALGPALELTLVYNSQDLRLGPFGNGWTHSYDQRLVLADGETQKVAIVRQPNGKRDRFIQNSDGTYTPPPSVHASLRKNQDGTHTLREPNGVRREFDAEGKLVAVADRNGNTLTLSYDQTGFLTSETDATGRVLQFTKGANGRVSSVADPANRVFRYAYDANGNLVSFTDPLGNAGTLQYGTDKRVTSITDQRGNQRLHLSYDASGRVATFVDGAETWAFTYQPDQKRTLERDSQNNVWTYFYNESGSIVRRTDPLGNSEQLAYDADLNLTEFTDKSGRKTTYTYDSRGNLLTTKDALGNTRSATYDSTFNQLLTIQDARGKTTRFDYDSRGNLIKVTTPLNQATQLQYDAKGQLLKMTDAAGHVSTFGYDAFGNQTQAIDARGNSSTTAFDILGKVTSFTDAEGRVTQYVYDANERLTRITNALGDPIAYDYDAANNVVLITLPNGAQTKFEYDVFNRVMRATDSLSQSRTYTYNSKNFLASTTDSKGQQISYTYDALGRLLRKTTPEGATNYAYDKVNNLLSVSGPESTITYTYDALNRVASTQTGATSAQLATLITYSYDANGARASMTDPAGGVTSYVYDDNSRLSSLIDPSGLAVGFSYDNISRRTQITRGSLTTKYSYDAANHLLAIDHQSPAGQFLINYTYDRVGNRLTMGDASGSRAFSYDALHQLTAAVQPAGGALNELYSYDKIGNRLSSHLAASHTYDSANRLLADVKYDYIYDANGNLTRKSERATAKATSYTYNSENRLTRIDLPDGLATSYKYDALGRRIEKNVDGQVTRYVYDGHNILFEYSGAGGVAARYVHGPGVDEPLAVRRGSSTSFFEFDALGSVLRVITGSGVSSSLTYDSFGRITSQAGSPVAPYAFQGREFDAESGLYYFRERYYDPQAGRFISQDPLGFAAGANFYTFVTNNPVNGWDPFGLSGTLTIHSSGSGGPSGHSWVTYTTDSGKTTTYGTWGNNPHGLGNGLQENLEAGWSGDASRSKHIDDAAEAQLYAEIQRYKDQGEDAWGYLNPCSGFASDAWKAGTGESLNSRDFLGISTPTNLRDSIEGANKPRGGRQCTFGGSSGGSNSSSSSGPSSFQGSNSSINGSSSSLRGK
ncbi:MAG TPA: RHS repeat-associated core domain-containing protein [Pyrinomonadaceae bacterium]|nr:RHS repeat-associated core domain-containing protein [Pyrinomonadaceae bacterium]